MRLQLLLLDVATSAVLSGALGACGEGDRLAGSDGVPLQRADALQSGQPLIDCDSDPRFTFFDPDAMVMVSCKDLQDQDFTLVRGAYSCQFEYQLCKGREAYDRAFSFVKFQSTQDHIDDLGEAANRFLRAAVWPRMVYSGAEVFAGFQLDISGPIVAEHHYIELYRPDLWRSDEPPVHCQISQAGFDACVTRSQAVRDEALDYYLSHVLQALVRYFEVVDALIEASEASSDAAGRTSRTFADRKRGEFIKRSTAASVLIGAGAILPACTVDVDHPSVSLALAGLRESGGDRGAAATLTGLDPSWIAQAARHQLEQRVAERPELFGASSDAGIIPGNTGVDPVLYLRSISERSTGFLSCGRWVAAQPDFQAFYPYQDGALAPDFSGVNPADAYAHFLGAADDPLARSTSFAVRSGGTCTPIVKAADMTSIPGHLRILEDLHPLGEFPFNPFGDEPTVFPITLYTTGIANLLDEALGQGSTFWNPPSWFGSQNRIAVSNFLLPDPSRAFLVFGADALRRLVRGEASGTALTTAALFDGSRKIWERQASALAAGSGGVYQIDQFFGTQHPLRAYCSQNPTAVGCDRFFVQGNLVFADDLFLLRQRVPAGVNTDGTVRTVTVPISIYLYYEYDAQCPPGESCFPVPTDTPGLVSRGLVVDWMSPADLQYGFVQGKRHRRGGQLERRLRRAVAREEKQCAEFRFNSLGMAKRLVPPLENELNDNLDPYENSFKTYLDSAVDAALGAASRIRVASDKESQLRSNIALYEAEAENAEAEAVAVIEEICGVGTGQADLTATPPVIGCEAAKQSIAIGAIGNGRLLPPAGNLINLSPTLPSNCTQTLGTVPTISNFKNAAQVATALDGHRQLVQCAAREVITQIRNVEIPDLPAVFADGVFTDQEKAMFGGRYKMALIAIDNEMLSFGQSVIGIATAMQSLDARLEGAKAQVSNLITSAKGRTADALVHVGELVQGFGNTIGQAAQGNVFGALVGWAGTIVGTEGREGQLAEQYRKEEQGAHAFVSTFIADMLQSVGDLKVAGKTLQISVNNILVHIEELKLLEMEQRQAIARAQRQVEILGLTTGVKDPLTYTTLNQANFAARRAIRRSKVLSYIARKAIEFRLVIDLSKETAGSAIVEAPVSWADDLFILEDDAAQLPPVGGTGQFDPQDDPFARVTIQYTQRLGDFISYYPFRYPFQGNADTAVLSLKDDLVPNQFKCDSFGFAVDFAGVRSTGTCRCVSSTGQEINVASNSGDFADKCTAAVDGTGNSLGGTVAAPYDFDGVLLRQSFKVKCRHIDVLEPSWRNNCPREDVQYYQIDFNLSLAGIESGRLARQGQIATGRYNYRVDRVAANLVGSNVKDCTLDPVTSSACFANSFLPFTFIHAGNVSLHDHGRTVRSYPMTTARVESGKALAAERFLTSPLASADSQLIEQYMNTELRGRPLQGVYSFRIVNTPSLAFSELQDVQLALVYRSWTAFDPID